MKIKRAVKQGPRRLAVTSPAQVTKCKSLIFAPAGHGKTTFLGTAQEDERTAPMLFLDFEAGTQSLVGLDIDVVRIRAWDDFNEVYDYLTSDSVEKEYKSVGIDSISETNIFALLKVLDTDAKRPDPDMPGQPDYGKTGTQMRRFVRHFKDLPMHVFMSALAKDDVEARVGTIKKPALIGQMADEIPGIMDTVAYLAKVVAGEDDDEEERILLLHGYPKYRIKVRTPWKQTVPTEIEDPTVGRLLDVLGFEE